MIYCTKNIIEIGSFWLKMKYVRGWQLGFRDTLF